MLPGLQSVRGSAGEDPKATLTFTQASAQPDAVPVPVGGTALSDLAVDGDKSPNGSVLDFSSSASSHCPEPLLESGAPRQGSRSVLHPKRRARVQNPYPTGKLPRLAERDSSPLRPLQGPQFCISSEEVEGTASRNYFDRSGQKRTDTETMAMFEDPEQLQQIQQSLGSLEQTKSLEYLSEIKRLKYELEQKDKELAFLRKQNETQDACIQADYVAVTAESLLSEDVLAETVLEATGEGQQTLTWLSYGLRITVPAGAVPAGTTISFAIRVLLSGDFDMPEDTHLVSAIYWITTNGVFKKDVVIHVEHCAIIRDQLECSVYRFLTGSGSQSGLPYVLNLTEGGLFTPLSDEASISMRHHSFFAAVHVGEKRPSYSTYIGQLFYRPCRGLYVWQLDYVVTQYVSSVLSYVKEDYKKDGWTSHHEQRLEYEEGSEVLTLRIGEPRSRPEKWEVTTVSSPKVTKWDVDHVQRRSWPPYCRLSIKWKGEPCHVFPDVSCPVNIEGVKSSYNYFCITLPNQEYIQPFPDERYTQAPDNGIPIEEDELPEAIKAVKHIAQVKFLAIRLGLHMSIVENIDEDCSSLDEQKDKVICNWVKRIGIVRRKQGLRATWNELANAVAGEDLALAEHIRQTHCMKIYN